jgi:hypothetical protein
MGGGFGQGGDPAREQADRLAFPVAQMIVEIVAEVTEALRHREPVAGRLGGRDGG